MAKQRRGKGDKVQPSSPDDTSTTTTTNETISVDQQIQTAKLAVHKSIATVNAMHIQWRNSLMRMGYMVVLITIHQWQVPITSCLHDVKSYNKAMQSLDNDNLRLSGKQAIFYVLYGSFCEMLGFLMGVFLALFLRQMHSQAAVTLVTPDGKIEKNSFFANKFYMVATGLLPPLVNLFFHIQAENNKSTADGTIPSCMDHPSLSIMSQKISWQRYGEDHPSLRGFPVIIIFHIVATACCWFMDMQQSQQHTNLDALEKLRKELTTAQTKNAIKKSK